MLVQSMPYPGAAASGVFLFGSNAAPTALDTNFANLQMGAAYQAPASGTVGSLVLRGSPTTSSAVNFYACIYAATSETVWGGALLGQTAIQNGLGVGQVKSMPLLAPAAIVAGSWYALTILVAGTMDFGSIAGSSASRFFSDTYSDGPLTTALASSLNGSKRMSLYAVT